MLALLLSLLVLAALMFALFRSQKQKNSSPTASRIANEYAVLISLLTHQQNGVVKKAGSRSFKISFTKNKDLHSYHLSEVDNRLIVVWSLDSKTHGKRGKEWSFNTGYDQQLMYSEIAENLGVYNQLLFREA